MQTTVKTFEGCDVPVRVAKFVARKHWIVAGGVSPVTLLLSVFKSRNLHLSPLLSLANNQIEKKWEFEICIT